MSFDIDVETFYDRFMADRVAYQGRIGISEANVAGLIDISEANWRGRI